MDIATLLARSWQTATTGDDAIHSARDIVERWYNKGGDLARRTRRFMLWECLWIAVHYRDTEAVLTRQFRLLAVLLYLGGYFPKGDAACMLPEKCFILLNYPEQSALLTDSMTSDVLASSCRDLYRRRRPSPVMCYRHTRCLSEHLYQMMMLR